MKQSF